MHVCVLSTRTLCPPYPSHWVARTWPAPAESDSDDSDRFGAASLPCLGPGAAAAHQAAASVIITDSERAAHRARLGWGLHDSDGRSHDSDGRFHDSDEPLHDLDWLSGDGAVTAGIWRGLRRTRARSTLLVIEPQPAASPCWNHHRVNDRFLMSCSPFCSPANVRMPTCCPQV